MLAAWHVLCKPMPRGCMLAARPIWNGASPCALQCRERPDTRCTAVQSDPLPLTHSQATAAPRLPVVREASDSPRIRGLDRPTHLHIQTAVAPMVPVEVPCLIC